MVHWAESLLTLRPGDFGRGFLFSLYYFLIIASYVEGRVARDALFLGHFKAVQLPYVEFAVAALVGFIVALYLRMARWASLRNLLIGSLLFYAFNLVAFWWLARQKPPWLYPVVYVWMGIYGVLATTQLWTLANYRLTTREGKRLFGMIGAGGILGGIFGGFFSNRLARAFGTESLLLSMAIWMAICAGLVALIYRRQSEVEAGDSTAAVSEESPQTLRDSFRAVLSSPHLRVIAALICVASFVTTNAGWQFKATAKQYLVEKDALAAFFGSFYGYTGILSLAAQLLVTSRLLKRFGVGIALFVLPIALTAGSTLMLVWPFLWAAVLLRGADQVLRYSVDTSALQCLYLPVPAQLKLQVKSFLDTVIWRLGDGLAAVTLLILATYLQLTPSQISYASLALLAIWLLITRRAAREYVATLSETIHQHRLDAERVETPVLERSAANIVLTQLKSEDVDQVLYAMNLLELGRRPVTHSAVRDLLDHADHRVRYKALRVLRSAGDREAIPQVENLLRDTNLEVRTEALLFLAHYTHVDPLARIEQLGDVAEFSVRSATVAFLARSEDDSNLDAARLILDGMVGEKGRSGRNDRLEAARLVSILPDHFELQIYKLFHDEDTEVLGEAIRSAGVLGKRRFVSGLIEHLGNPDLTADVVESLSRFGDRIVGALGDYLADSQTPIEIRRVIPEVLRRIGTVDSARILMTNVLQGDSALRLGIVTALNKLQKRHRHIELDRRTVEAVLAAEILGHYRSYQIMGTLDEQTGSVSLLPLQTSITLEVERIFRLLELLYPQHDFQTVFRGLQSKDRTERDNALEFLDNTLSAQVRTLLVPLLDAEVSSTERMNLANRILGARLESKHAALEVLARSEDTWLKSCAAHLIGALRVRGFEKELDQWTKDPDPVLRENAVLARTKLASERLPTHRV